MRKLLDITSHDPCKACGGAVVKREDEDAHGYLRRVTCSPECRWRAIGVSHEDGAGWWKMKNPWPEGVDFGPYNVRVAD